MWADSIFCILKPNIFNNADPSIIFVQKISRNLYQSKNTSPLLVANIRISFFFLWVIYHHVYTSLDHDGKWNNTNPPDKYAVFSNFYGGQYIEHKVLCVPCYWICSYKYCLTDSYLVKNNIYSFPHQSNRKGQTVVRPSQCRLRVC